MLLLSQIREELALYFELISAPKTAAERVIKDRVVTLHNELVKAETVVAAVPVSDLVAANGLLEGAKLVGPASFAATIGAVTALVEARMPKQPETPEPAPVPVAPVEVVD